MSDPLLDANQRADTLPASLDDGGPRAGAPGAPLVLHQVSKVFRRPRRVVLHRVDLTVERGELVHVSGRNGAGKTTLLRVAAGLLAPDEGEVCVFDRSPERERREVQRRIGFLSAGTGGIYARLTVNQHLELWGRLALLSRQARREGVEQAIEDFQLHDLRRRRLDRMSMGQRQRVRLSMAFLHAPDLVLLDEPANSLDEPGLELLAAAAGRTLARGGAVIYCAPSGVAHGLVHDRRLEVRDGGVYPG